MKGKQTANLKCGVPATMNSLMTQKARYTYHARLKMMHHEHSLACNLRFLNKKMAAIAKGHVIIKKAKSIALPNEDAPFPSMKHKL